ncbi:MAG: DUF2971 domain-containing protein [Burkholderiaceae bacterium]
MNDPLDSSIDIEKEYERTREHISSIDSHPDKRLSFLFFLLNSSDRFKNPVTGEKLTLNQAVHRFMQQLGILSLSKTPRDALLWSHYANGHKGICLEFESEELELENVFICSEVRYLEEPPYKDIFLRLTHELGSFVRPWDNHHHSNEEGDAFYTKQLSELMRGNLLVKSKKWGYEEEYRMISSKSGCHSFDPKALKRVIFGCKTSVSDVESVHNILSRADYKHVKTCKVEHQEGTFEFDLGQTGR